MTSANHAIQGRRRKEHIRELESLVGQLTAKRASVQDDVARRDRIDGAMATLEKRLYLLESGPTGNGPASAVIANATASRAAKVPGVKAVITHRDSAGVMVGPDQQLLCDEMVYYIGDEVAAVAAIDEDTALEAAELIKIDYQPLPALLSLEEAIAPGAPVLHQYYQDNYADEKLLNFGDVDKAFAESDYVRTDEFDTFPAHNCFAELHGTIVDYSLPGKVAIWTPSQTAILIQKGMAQSLGLSESQVRVLNLNTGGAFSGRGAVRPHHLIAAVLSRKAC